MIDLGVPVDHEPGAPPAPPWVRGFGRRRTFALLGVLVICGGLLGAATPAGPGAEIVTVGGLGDTSAYEVAGDALVLITSARIAAYDLGSGRPRWELRLDSPPDSAQVYGDALLITRRPRGTRPADTELPEGTELVAYDVRTGAVRWTRHAEVFGEFGETGLLVTEPGTPPELVSIDVPRGTELWRRPAPDGVDRDFDWRPAYIGDGGHSDNLVELAADGTVTAVDLRSGRAVSTGAVPAGGGERIVWQGVLGVSYAAEHRIRFYDLDDRLRPLWSFAYTGQEPNPCGPEVVCDYADQTRWLDLRTGEDVTAREADRDAREGRELTAAGWARIGPATGGLDLVTTAHASGWIGRYAPGKPVSVLVRLPQPVDRCTATAAWLVCSRTGEDAVYAVRLAQLPL
ncbi:outer membrane protein assembly factor BamB family protein [Hamadaea tsunoensis]|uniref:outer membrane protein assembly factor BamB family protein n=1 Tax=Hamadaea tsunoensis TaxID=53368 RepID=UPI00041FE91C|nr:PQQ-binding-like beta-propeller repeat protein [Hamadaea tsunoensis]